MGEGGNQKFFYGSNLFLLDIKDFTQIFNIVALLLFWLNLKFTPKYNIVGDEGGGGLLYIFLSSKLILWVIHEPMQSFKIVALLILQGVSKKMRLGL